MLLKWHNDVDVDEEVDNGCVVDGDCMRCYGMGKS
jgi:hypothetical protein